MVLKTTNFDQGTVDIHKKIQKNYNLVFASKTKTFFTQLLETNC